MTFIPLPPSCPTTGGESALGKGDEDTCPKPSRERRAEPRDPLRPSLVHIQPRTQAHLAWHSRAAGHLWLGLLVTSQATKAGTGSALAVNHEELWKPLRCTDGRVPVSDRNLRLHPCQQFLVSQGQSKPWKRDFPLLFATK